MIFYRDRRWCTFEDCAKFGEHKCTRSFTKSHQIKSVQLGLPVEQFLEKPKCFEDVG